MYNKVVVESIHGVIEYIYVPKEVDALKLLEGELDSEWTIVEIVENESEIPSNFEECIVKGIKIYQ